MYLHVWVQVCVCVHGVCEEVRGHPSVTPWVLSNFLSEMVSYWPGTL